MLQRPAPSHLRRLIIFSLLLILGLALNVLLDQIRSGPMPGWVINCIDTTAYGFVWQFVGFCAFEYRTSVKEMHRLKQLSEAEFEFELWE